MYKKILLRSLFIFWRIFFQEIQSQERLLNARLHQAQFFNAVFEFLSFTYNLGTEESFVLNYTRIHHLIAPNQTQEAVPCLLNFTIERGDG